VTSFRLADALKGMLPAPERAPARPLQVEVNVYAYEVVHHITFTLQVGFVMNYSIETKYVHSPLRSVARGPSYARGAPARLHPERVRNANMFEFMEWLSDMEMLEDHGIYILLGRSTLERGYLDGLSQLLLAFSLSRR